jgi:Yip1 domain
MENEQINPWLKIWTEPRKTMRAILSTDRIKNILYLAIVGGILAGISFALSLQKNPPNIKTMSAVPFISLLIAGGLLGIFNLYFGGWLYRLTGSWIGGKGDFTDLKCAVGWSNYPYIIASLFSIISLLSIPNIWLQGFFGLLNFIAVIWGVVIFLKLISEAHQFSVWKGILTVIIASVLITVVILIIGLLVPLLKPLFQ